MNRAEIVGAIVAERERQIELWGDQTGLSLSRLMNIITEEVGESATEVNDILQEMDKWAQTNRQALPPVGIMRMAANLETELIQTAACCLKMLEALNLGNYRLE